MAKIDGAIEEGEMSEWLMVAAASGIFGLAIGLLVGTLIGQGSTWRWLHRRYDVSWEEPFYQWLDRQLEKLRYLAKSWEDFTESLDQVGRDVDD